MVGSHHLGSKDSFYNYYTEGKSVAASAVGGSAVAINKKQTQQLWAITTVTSADDGGWSLRLAGSEIIGICCAKYAVIFPDLQSRVVKTYMEGLGVGNVSGSSGEALTQKSLNTIYGAITGLSTLSTAVVGQILLPRLSMILTRLTTVGNALRHEKSSLTWRSASNQEGAAASKFKEQKQQLCTVEQMKLLLIQVLGMVFFTDSV